MCDHPRSTSVVLTECLGQVKATLDGHIRDHDGEGYESSSHILVG